jgi:hypothetical protein
MTSKRNTWAAMLTAFFVTLVASRGALAVNTVNEAESFSDPATFNDPATKAEKLVVDSDGIVEVNGSIYNTVAHRDTDFYSFYGTKGDIVTIDIDGGMDANFVGVWTALGLFGPDGATLDSVYLADSLDPGSVSVQDARIDNFVLPASGFYTVGVSSMPGYFVSIDSLYSGEVYDYSPYYGVNGTYTLIISGVTPLAAPAPAPTSSVKQIGIDIRPGKRDVIWVHTASRRDAKRERHDSDRRHDLAEAMRGHFKGGIPVALLSSDSFNAMDVDQTKLHFGSNGDEDSLMRCNSRGVDVNHDGLPDLICHFNVAKANFEPGDTEGIVTGTTQSGDDFEGRGFLKVISGKRDPKHHRSRHHRH